MANGGFDRNQHLCKYITCLPPDVQIFLAKDLINNIEALCREIGFADIVVFIMGTNDLVSEPLELDTHLNDMLKVGVMLVANRTTRYVAYMEVFSRLMPNGFGKKAAEQFKVKKGVRCPRDIDNYYWSLAMIYNSKLSARVANHPDFFVINLDALKYNPRQWLLADGIHLNVQGKLKLQLFVKRDAIKITSPKRVVPRFGQASYNYAWGFPDCHLTPHGLVKNFQYKVGQPRYNAPVPWATPCGQPVEIPADVAFGASSSGSTGTQPAAATTMPAATITAADVENTLGMLPTAVITAADLTNALGTVNSHEDTQEEERAEQSRSTEEVPEDRPISWTPEERVRRQASLIEWVKRKRERENGDNSKELMVEESSTEKSSAETEEEKVEDTREVILDRMVDEESYPQFSPEVSIYSSSSEDELPELSAGQARTVELVYAQERSVEAPQGVEEELGAAPTVQLDFVPEEGREDPSSQELWQEAKLDVE